jgi:hypothetical protein
MQGMARTEAAASEVRALEKILALWLTYGAMIVSVPKMTNL